MTANEGIATPKAGTPQTYIFFYYSMNETKSAVGAFHFLRWRLRFGNSHTLNFPYASDTTNTGGVRVHGVRVHTVVVQ